MNYAKSFTEKLKNNFKDSDVYFNEHIEAQVTVIRNLIKERWLLGKTPNGDAIGLYFYSKVNYYALFKYNEISSIAGLQNVDLTLTGSLGDKISLNYIDDGEYEIFSRDEKYNKIKEKYGAYNFNITDTEKEQIINKILPYIIGNIYKGIL